MAGATLAASQQSVEMLTVHASAGVEAMKAAVQNAGLTKILAVTVLTSIDADKCLSIFGDFPEKKVVRFATMALKAGIHGIVCSPKEVEAIRAIPEFNKFIVVCPGIRLKDQVIENDDQARKMTPYEAIRAGADLIVVGRPITSSQNPTAMAQRVIEEIAEAMAPTRTAA